MMIQARAIKQLLTFFLLTAFSLVNTVYLPQAIEKGTPTTDFALTTTNTGIRSISDLPQYSLAAEKTAQITTSPAAVNVTDSDMQVTIQYGGNYMGIDYNHAEQPIEAAAVYDIQPVGHYVDGIDVSNWQADINWNLVHDDGIRFAVVKATEGWGFRDARFYQNIQNARNAHVLVGAYHFARPDLNNSPQNEATWFASQVSPYLVSGNLRPVLDLERLVPGGDWLATSVWTDTFMITFKNLTGVEPIIYMNSNYSNHLDPSLNKYDLWIAHWKNIATPPNTGAWDEWVMWQWGGSSVSGITTGNVDSNVTKDNFYKAIISDPVLPLGQGFMGASYEDAEQPAANSTGGFSVQSEEYLHGIDVSNHQNTIQWPLVADDGMTFAIAKATEGWGYEDAYFEDNMRQADAAGVIIGAYHFARPDLNNTAVSEATWFASVVGPYLGEGNIRPVLDLERQGSYTWDQLSIWANDFMVTFENLTGVEPMLYINSNYANRLNSSLNHYDLWIAHWHDINIPPNTGRWSNWVLWQWGGTAVNGVPGTNVDRNVSRSNLHDAVIGDTVFWTTN